MLYPEPNNYYSLDVIPCINPNQVVNVCSTFSLHGITDLSIYAFWTSYITRISGMIVAWD